MTVIAVANPKGGVGKSTIAVNLAGCLARHGHPVALADLDENESAQLWLSLRPRGTPPIHLWALDRGRGVPLPAQARDAVIDTPAGVGGALLDEVLSHADRVIVPLQPGLFDLAATRHFVERVLHQARYRGTRVAVVANRVREHTLLAEHMRRFVSSLDAVVLTELRDTQFYAQLAAQGLTVWDVPPHRIARDIAQWQPIAHWLGLSGGAPSAAH